MPTLLNDSSLDKSRFDTNFRLRFGRDLLKWTVLILLPSFLVCALGLVSYEVYYELSTTGGKGKRFKKLVASLRLAGERRIRIHEAQARVHQHRSADRRTGTGPYHQRSASGAA